MDKEGLKERKAYYEKLMGWLLTGLFAIAGGLAGLLISGLDGTKFFLFAVGTVVALFFLSAVLGSHFSVIEIIKKLEGKNGA